MGTDSIPERHPLAGCATSYQPKSFSGGYSEIRLREDLFEVSFQGNGSTSRERAADFALLRSAEVALENGFPYFVIISEDQKPSMSSYTRGLQPGVIRVLLLSKDLARCSMLIRCVESATLMEYGAVTNT